jgi:hypothetical protein
MEEPASSRLDTLAQYVFKYSLNRYALIIGPPQNFPDHQFPSIVGRPILRSEERQGDFVLKDIMCGDEAAAARSALQISYPVCSAGTWHNDHD